MDKLSTLATKPQKALSTSLATNTALPAEVSSDLNAMFMALDMPAELAAEPTLTKRLYAEAIAGLPAGLCRDTIARYRTGRLGNGKWCPKPGELRQAVCAAMDADAARRRQERIIEDQLAERRRLEEMRANRDPEEMDRVAALVADYRSHLDIIAPDRGSNVPRQPTQEEAREWLEAHEGGSGLEPVAVSGELQDYLVRTFAPDTREAAE